MSRIPFLLFGLLSCLVSPFLGEAADHFVLKGKIVDPAGEPVGGAEVYVYASPQVRRAADFISGKSDRFGGYRIEIPAGKYWAVARLRDPEARSPFQGVQKHSGEPAEVEASAGGEGVADFTIAQVRDLAKRQRKSSSGEFVKIEGKIVDREGHPVPGAYAYARRDGSSGPIPDFLSYQSDQSGNYALYLPPGKYCLGGAAAFPPEESGGCKRQTVVNSTIGLAMDLQLEYLNAPKTGRGNDKEASRDD